MPVTLKSLMGVFGCLVFILSNSSCSKQEAKFNNVKRNDSTKTFTLTDNQRKVLAGAKKCLEAGFKYDKEMAYHVLKYNDTEYVGSKVFPNGDLDPSLGVCTEVTIRALRWGGVCDLQEEIHNDIEASWNDYPMSRWNASKSDPNIDHRRVPNQLVWFKKYWQEVKETLPSPQVKDPAPKVGREGPGVRDYQPGDVVVWDMNGDGWSDHIGIFSDYYSVDGMLKVIHNFPSPGYAAEEDVLNRWEIVGVFRIRN